MQNVVDCFRTLVWLVIYKNKKKLKDYAKAIIFPFSTFEILLYQNPIFREFSILMWFSPCQEGGGVNWYLKTLL